MENCEVIEHVTEPSDWVNSLFVVEKPNRQLRICLAPRHLNRAIKRQHLQLPTAEEIIVKMSGTTFLQSWMHRLAIGRSKWIKKALNYSHSPHPLVATASNAYRME